MYYEPVIAIASAKDYVKEDEIGKEFYDSYCMVIKLKDEYAEVLSQENNNYLKISVATDLIMQRVEIENGNIILGDEI